MYDLEKIKDVAIEDVAVKLGMRVVRHMALCPFHADKVASLHFSKDKKHWKCFACSKGGAAKGRDATHDTRQRPCGQGTAANAERLLPNTHGTPVA